MQTAIDSKPDNSRGKRPLFGRDQVTQQRGIHLPPYMWHALERAAQRGGPRTTTSDVLRAVIIRARERGDLAF